ncbi:MAG: hypothetical protein QG656_2339, partial [Candidatus Hydrogenedentes bacterium]|nr:hypothetical protein [Candidatus Hydrogenedentota bacterium]
MKIFHLTPGSGGTFYCQNCYRDAALLRALRRRGHDVMMLPMYLPIFSDTDGASTHSPIFFGGINVYLQQRFRLFQK